MSSKADKMFEKLGYKISHSTEKEVYFDNESRYSIGFEFERKMLDIWSDGVRFEVFLAIHEKMKELGWFDDR